MRLVLYLDDMVVVAQTRKMTRECLATTLELLFSLGFIIDFKSVLKPTHKIEFLAFQITSQRMMRRSSHSTIGPDISPVSV